MQCGFTAPRIGEDEEKHPTDTFLIAFESEHHEEVELSPSPLCHQLDWSTQELHKHSVSHYPAMSNYSSRGRLIWFLKNSYCIVACDNHHYKYPVKPLNGSRGNNPLYWPEVKDVWRHHVTMSKMYWGFLKVIVSRIKNCDHFWR